LNIIEFQSGVPVTFWQYCIFFQPLRVKLCQTKTKVKRVILWEALCRKLD